MERQKVVVNGMRKAPTLRRLTLQCCVLTVFLILCILTLRQAQKHYARSLYPRDHAVYVEEAAEACELPPSLIYAIIHTESSFRTDALSKAGAKGLMQLTDDTYLWALQRAGKEESYDPQALFDPRTNISCGTYVVSLLNRQFDNIETVLAAYNAGQGRVKEWLKDPAYSQDGKTLTHIPYPETREYVLKVLDAQQQYQQIYSMD